MSHTSSRFIIFRCSSEALVSESFRSEKFILTSGVLEGVLDYKNTTEFRELTRILTKHERNLSLTRLLWADGLYRPPNNRNRQGTVVLCLSECWHSKCLIKFSCVKAEAL